MTVGGGPPAVRPQLKVDRIGRSLLFTTALVRSQLGPGLISAGTSFFYDGYLGDASSGVSIPMLITNKHVIGNATGGTVRLLRAENGEPSLGNSVEINFHATDWVGHPDPYVDVTAVAIGGVLAQLEQQGTPVFFRQITRDLLPAPEVIDDLDVVEPVTFVGYPASLFDTANLTPIIRRGTTATPIQLNYCDNPQFLIDASIFPGSSGSPVFIVNENGYRQGTSFVMGTSRVLFLGIVAAVHQQTSTGRIVTATTPQVQFDQMVDLGLVFKWTAVEETISELCQQRGIDRLAPTEAS